MDNILASLFLLVNRLVVVADILPAILFDKLNLVRIQGARRVPAQRESARPVPAARTETPTYIVTSSKSSLPYGYSVR
jgi:hypothetical protein